MPAGSPESLTQLIENFDEERFQFLMNKIRINLLRGRKDLAKISIDQFQSSVADIHYDTNLVDAGMLYKVASCIEQLGYFTVGSVVCMSDDELKKMRKLSNLGEMFHSHLTAKRLQWRQLAWAKELLRVPAETRLAS